MFKQILTSIMALETDLLNLESEFNKLRNDFGSLPEFDQRMVNEYRTDKQELLLEIICDRISDMSKFSTTILHAIIIYADRINLSPVDVILKHVYPICCLEKSSGIFLIWTKLGYNELTNILIQNFFHVTIPFNNNDQWQSKIIEAFNKTDLPIIQKLTLMVKFSWIKFGKNSNKLTDFPEFNLQLIECFYQLMSDPNLSIEENSILIVNIIDLLGNVIINLTITESVISTMIQKINIILPLITDPIDRQIVDLFFQLACINPNDETLYTYFQLYRQLRKLTKPIAINKGAIIVHECKWSKMVRTIEYMLNNKISFNIVTHDCDDCDDCDDYDIIYRPYEFIQFNDKLIVTEPIIYSTSKCIYIVVYNKKGLPLWRRKYYEYPKLQCTSTDNGDCIHIYSNNCLNICDLNTGKNIETINPREICTTKLISYNYLGNIETQHFFYGCKKYISDKSYFLHEKNPTIVRFDTKTRKVGYQNLNFPDDYKFNKSFIYGDQLYYIIKNHKTGGPDILINFKTQSEVKIFSNISDKIKYLAPYLVFIQNNFIFIADQHSLAIISKIEIENLNPKNKFYIIDNQIMIIVDNCIYIIEIINNTLSIKDKIELNISSCLSLEHDKSTNAIYVTSVGRFGNQFNLYNIDGHNLQLIYENIKGTFNDINNGRMSVLRH